MTTLLSPLGPLFLMGENVSVAKLAHNAQTGHYQQPWLFPEWGREVEWVSHLEQPSGPLWASRCKVTQPPSSQ